MEVQFVHQPMLKRDNGAFVLGYSVGVGVEDGLGRGWHHHGEAGDMGKEGLEALGMLGTLAPATSDNHSYQHWDVEVSAEHVAILCRHVDDLIHTYECKICTDVGLDWIESVECHPDGYPGRGFLGKRRVDYPVGILLWKSKCGAEYTLVVCNPLANYHHLGV